MTKNIRGPFRCGDDEDVVLRRRVLSFPRCRLEVSLRQQHGPLPAHVAASCYAIFIENMQKMEPVLGEPRVGSAVGQSSLPIQLEI